MSEETRVEIPAPRFEIYETVKPTPGAAIKPASPVGKVESRSWVEFAERPGYWRYTVRWPGGGTSSSSDEYLDKGCRVDCGLRVIVSGVPVIVRSWTTQSVDAAIAMALKVAGVSREGATGWTLRTEDGAELKHMVGDAKIEDEGETTLFLDPDVGGGGDDEPSEAEAAGQVWPKGSPERRRIERRTQASHDLARDLAEGAGWKGTPPAEGTRRALIRNALAERIKATGPEGEFHDLDGFSLALADVVEEALLKVVDQGATPESGSPASVAMDVLDGLRIDRTREGAILTIAQRVTVAADELVERRREIVDAGNEFDRISIARADEDRRTLTLPERAKLTVARVLTEEESKRLLAATIDAQAQLRDNPHLPAEARKRFEDSLGVPPKGSREREIYDALLHVKVKLADGIAREHTLLDRDSVREVAAVLEKGLKGAPAGDVAPGTRELHVVVRRISEPGAHPEYQFVEIENETGASVTFPWEINPKEEVGPEFVHIVIPYGRGDAWVSEVAYQAAGAATRPLLEDHPDYVFPSERVADAVADLLSDFGIARACRPCAYEEIEQGAKEVGDRRDATIKGLKAEVERLLDGRESARAGEDHFKAQRDSALHLVRWLIGDIIPPDLIRLGDCEEPS